MKNVFKKGTRVALFVPDTHGVLRFKMVVYIAKISKGFASISYSQDGEISETNFEIIKGSNICRTAHQIKKELRPIDDACERLEEIRILCSRLRSHAVDVEFALKQTDIQTLSDLVGREELSRCIEIVDTLRKKLGDGTKPKS